MQKIILHDTRLDGRVRPGVGRVIEVDGNTPLSRGFQLVVKAVTMSPAELVIACHGFMSQEYDKASHEKSRGGKALMLFREHLHIGNVSKVSALKGHFRRIWLMACGPAGKVVHNSRPFCREFAHYADTVVIAPDRPQVYHRFKYDSSDKVTRQVLKFGAWEGKVYQFFPDGTVKEFAKCESPLP